MSYEGYVEYLCSKGHLSSLDVYFYDDLEHNCCQDCGEDFVFQHSVDQTNGIEYDEDDKPLSGTIAYPFKEVSFEDIWHEDHHGNRYATKRLIFEIPKKE